MCVCQPFRERCRICYLSSLSALKKRHLAEPHSLRQSSLTGQTCLKKTQMHLVVICSCRQQRSLVVLVDTTFACFPYKGQMNFNVNLFKIFSELLFYNLHTCTLQTQKMPKQPVYGSQKFILIIANLILEMWNNKRDVSFLGQSQFL